MQYNAMVQHIPASLISSLVRARLRLQGRLQLPRVCVNKRGRRRAAEPPQWWWYCWCRCV